MRTSGMIASGILAVTAVVGGSTPCHADEAEPLPAGAVARLGSTQLRTAGEIRSLAFSPDGRMVASGSSDGVVRLWDSQTSKEIRRFTGHEHGVTTVAFTRDGKRLASGSYDHTCRIWEVETGKQLLQITAGRSWVTSVALAPDGETVACACRNSVLSVYSTATGETVRELQGHSNWVTAVVFANDGKSVISGSKDRTIRRWDVETGKEIGRFAGQATMVYSLAMSADGKTLVSGSNDNDVHVWDVEAGTERFKLEGHTGSITAVACGADGRTVASASRDGTVRLWDLQTHKARQVIATGDGELTTVAMAPDNKLVASAGESQLVRLWDAATGKETRARRDGHTGAIVGLAFSQDGRVLVTNSRDNSLGVWDVQSGRQRLTMRGHRAPPYAIALSSDGKTLASLSEDRTARVFELADGTSTVVEQVNPEKTVDLIAVDGELRVWATTTRVAEARLELELRELLTSQQRFTIGIVPNPQAGLLVLRPTVTERVTAVAAAHHLPFVVAGTSEKNIILWDKHGTQLDKMTGHQGAICTLAFSNDDRILLSTAADGTLRLWEVASHQPFMTIGPRVQGAGSQILATLAPDGRSLAWAFADDRQIQFRDLVYNNDLPSLKGHVDPITALAFSPESRLIASGSADTIVLLWKNEPRTLSPDTLLNLDEPERLWAHLADDASTAYAAIWTLACTKPEQTVAFLKQRLPTERRKMPTIAELVNDLDSPTFQVRRLATEALENMGELVRTDLVKALDNKPTFEMQRRLEHILQTLDNRKGRLAPLELRQLRAVQVLESLGTAPARELLQEWAKGPVSWWQTREAQTALKRMANRP